MRATRLEISPTPFARARWLTRVRRQSRTGRNASPRDLPLLARRVDDVTTFIFQASVTRQKSAA